VKEEAKEAGGISKLGMDVGCREYNAHSNVIRLTI